VPWSQAAEVFIGLQRLGRHCTLLVYKGEGHAVQSLPNRRDLAERVLGWLNQHLGSPG
jgi:dipeptidyl aminopeptidase/acylaminoacyl peptidase